MPDIDVDFCFERRGEVIEYVRQRYGRASVGQIVTFGTMKARAAVKALVASEPPKSGGILSALRRSPLVGADLDLSRPREEGRRVEL